VGDPDVPVESTEVEDASSYQIENQGQRVNGSRASSGDKSSGQQSARWEHSFIKSIAQCLSSSYRPLQLQLTVSR
jgi:hypothetical protein